MNGVSDIRTQSNELTWKYHGEDHSISSLGKVVSAIATKNLPGIAVVATRENDVPRAYLLEPEGLFDVR